MILGWLDEAVKQGARRHIACGELGLDPRTAQRWRVEGPGDDQRAGPRTRPHNKLSAAERKRVVATANSPQFRDLPPKQIVPTLADEGRYIASESTFHRVLAEEKQSAHRGRTKPRSCSRPAPHQATGPSQVWSWDITYLRASVKGTFYYLYLYMDVWSRKVVGAEVHNTEDGQHAPSCCSALSTQKSSTAKSLSYTRTMEAP